jgi:ribosomal protein S18 acetylase RimI-like enzyme
MSSVCRVNGIVSKAARGSGRHRRSLHPVGLFHWIFGKHVPRPPDPERATLAGLVSAWEAPLVAEELAGVGIEAAFNDDHTSYLTTGVIESKVQVHVMEPDAAAARQIIQSVRDGRSDAPLLRPAQATDRAFLREMVYEAVFVPAGAEPPDPEILDTPELARYVDGFGTRPDDHGWVAVDETGAPIGAAWVRRWDPPTVGYGFVDASTPELSIAVRPERRGSGVGSGLLLAILEDVGRCSLSVDVRNPAAGLYRRFGFVVVGDHDGTLVMVSDVDSS